MAKFDSKSFNPEAFGKYVETLPKSTKDELIKSRVIQSDETIANLLSSQTGSYYATMPIHGRIGGDGQNYDGQTNITAETTDTFEQSIIAVGRAGAWVEKDFSYDITAGVDFMDQVGKQVADWWDGIHTGLLLSIIKGVFSMTGTENEKFVTAHTYDISGEIDNEVDATTLNSAVQKASGDNRGKFSMAFMHSAVAKNLENQNLLEYLKYTDANGVQRPLPLAHWNGRMVVVDDGMPVDTSGDEPKYTTYVFGEGAIRYADLGAKVPYEMDRDPAKNGGEDTLYTRKRMCFAPYGISFTKKSVASLSPTNAELANGANWTLVNNGKADDELKTIDHKHIAIARIVSLG